ncbi:HDIG domain-containing metalloprotein [Sandaracinus amylolyticus]|uniref:Membrane protein containing HD superfamily hydrolase n=1 Tax=Sandaracinus amylolyticus TaxID=927083 RepID=A0A0F6SF56_9BACT|nr:HDIG domain-containing metalloprotein [Sandaracinus amylolyticus]AKF06359.1 Membrane protein containing HD superfamily hydrolase [Sandaracinus amylolyticus]
MLRTRVVAGWTSSIVLALVFATLVTMFARIEVFVEPLRVVPGEPAPVTLRLAPTRIHATEDGHVRPIRMIAPRVARGEIVEDPVTAALVTSYEEARRPPRADEILGLFAVYFFLGLLAATWLRMLSPGRGALMRTQLGLLGITLLLVSYAKLYFLLTDAATTLVPIGALSLWVRVYLDRRTAFMIALVASCVVASMADFDPIAAVVFLACGMSPVLLVRDRKKTWTMLPAGVAGGIAGAALFAAARVLFVGEFDLDAELAQPLRSDFLGALASGPLAGIVAVGFHPLSWRALGAVSRQRLLELSDLDQPLLRKMAKEAPGSWEHARAMANLAEAAANAIGGDALLTRVGAYYHDLGKTIQPKLFVENLTRGEQTPHAQYEPDVSADAIMAHVVEGTNILRRGGVPEPVVEFAYTHHGTSVIEFFWHKTLEAGNPKGRDESFFRYPGMRPRTKETAILMLVDSIEAASRTIDPPERDKFEEMVQRIVFVKLRQGQLDESGLTLADLRTLTTQLVDTLCNVHHSRIRYPWQDRKDKGEKQLPIPGAATEEEVVRARAEAEEREADATPESETRPTDNAPEDHDDHDHH